MRDYRLGRLLSEAYQILKGNYLALTSVTAVFAMVYWLLMRLNPNLLDLTTFKEEGLFKVLATLLLSQIFTHAFLKKYYLVLIRQPEVVKANFLQALKHTFTDGFSKRLKYHLLHIVTLFGIFVITTGFFAVALFYMKEGSFFSTLSFESVFKDIESLPSWFKALFFLVLFVVQAHFFMVSYIIQDTLSEDNILIPLTYRGCLKHSIRLMKGNKGKYFALTAFSFLVEFVYVNLVAKVILTLMWSPLSFLSVGFLLFVTFLKFITVDTFMATANALLADVLLTEEWQIAFFGGENE